MAQARLDEQWRDLPDKGIVILVAEDNRVNQKLAILQLKELGITAHAVANGIEAVEAVKAHDYTLVLMDCQMPAMDGYQATQAIRHHEQSTGKHIPIVAMTAQTLEGDRERCLAVGMDDFIGKPVNSERLKKIIDCWLAKAGSTAARRDVIAEDGAFEASGPQTYACIYTDWEKTFGPQAAAALMTEIAEGSVSILAEMENAVAGQNASGLSAANHRLKGIWLALPDGPHAHIKELQAAIVLDDWSAIEKKQRLLKENLTSFLEKLPKFA